MLAEFSGTALKFSCLFWHCYLQPSTYIYSLLYSQVPENIFITPRYAQDHATFISTVASINDTNMYFGTGGSDRKLLEVPLISAGTFTRNESITIQITVGMDGGMLNSRHDRDPHVGVTDGSMENMFGIPDINNYPSYPPCTPISATGTLPKTFSTGPVPDQFTFLFKPAERFGACSSAIHGGYVNVGIFNNQLDLSRGIKLQIRKAEIHEDYRFYYFLVEIFQ